ncbi:hypothetical protein [Streptacidiphilus rugosus]|uniref:hypothetical protein n=1 Tax=Streptacidiphilus rugosus TaxID=405783 RepID=UPI00068CE24A|nr:hypothetical protein [Streptacidiphilus rugosus]
MEVQFTDAAGQRWSLFDKPPIFAALDELGPDSEYPMEVTVACVVREGHDIPEDDEIITVSTSPHGVMSPDGRDEFTVRRDQLVR